MPSMKTIAIVAGALLAVGCAGTEQDVTCPHPEASLAGTWALSLEGVCNGTVTVYEDVVAHSCGAWARGTWSCGAASGVVCRDNYSFRNDDYAQVNLCGDTDLRVYFSGAILTGDAADLPGVWQSGAPPHMQEGPASISRPSAQ